LISKLRAGLLLLVIAGFAAGCGDDDSSADTVTTSSLTKAEFVKRANEICSRERQKVLDSSVPTESKLIEEVALPAIQSSIDEVRSLGAPPGDAAEVEAVLVAMQQDVDAGEKQDPSSFVQFERGLKSSAAMARKYGISGCAFA
jgi:hypothetical protein